MLPVRIRRWISFIGTAAAIVTMIAVPVEYGWVAYQYEADNLAFKARLNAARVSKYIYTHGAMWTFHRVRLAELIELTEAKDVSVNQRIFDQKNKFVLEEGPKPSSPIFMRTASILLNGEPAGRIEVEAKLIGERPSGSTPVSSPIVQIASAVIQKFGMQPTHSIGSTDANIPISLRIPAITIDSGGNGGRAHSLDEWIDVEKNASVKGIHLVMTTLVSLAGLQ